MTEQDIMIETGSLAPSDTASKTTSVRRRHGLNWDLDTLRGTQTERLNAQALLGKQNCQVQEMEWKKMRKRVHGIN